MDLLDPEVLLECEGLLDLRASWDLKETEATLDHLEAPVLRVKWACPDCLGSLVRLARMETLDHLDPQDDLESVACLACLEFQDQRDTEDSLVLMEPKETQDLLERRVKMEHLDRWVL